MRTPKRRRLENKTDYLKRLKLLKSKRPRLVFRKTNRYIIAQYVESINAQDSVVMGIDSKELFGYGWPEEAKGSLKSISASYLTGLLMGKRILKKKLEAPIVDFGMIRNIHKSKTHAFLKGLVDAGLEIKVKEETFPEEERIKGEHMKNKIPFEKIKSKIEGEK
jgi:large subunit ribosomal protein L18